MTGETRPTRRRLLQATAACAVAGPLAWTAREASAAAPLQWPSVELLDGGTFGPEQAKAHDVVMVFWSTTCPFCRRHNQHVEKLHRAARAAQRPLRVLGVARDRDPEVVRRYAQAQGYSFPITMAAGPLTDLVGARRVIPLTVVVDKGGHLRQSIPGEMFEEDVMELLEGPR